MPANDNAHGLVRLPAGLVTLSPDVLDLARATFKRTDPEGAGPLVAAFTWAVARRMRFPGTNDFVELGPGPVLSADPRASWPGHAIADAEGVSWAVALPAWMPQAWRGGEIVPGPLHPRHLVLR